ncbi:hypothetical protein DIPPA_22174 [Diplonema papillatum]|nr:hypothetical protein DIPPA_22174 [Diplonema papillatum]
MKRVHPGGGRPRDPEFSAEKQLQDELLRLKEELLAVKEDRRALTDENRETRLQYAKVVNLVKGEKTALESIPAEFFAKDKGTEAYIKEMQAQVDGLKRTNRQLSADSQKWKAKAKTSGRGALPRYLNQSSQQSAARKPSRDKPAKASRRTVSKSSPRKDEQADRQPAKQPAPAEAAPPAQVVQKTHTAVMTSPRALVHTQTSPMAASLPAHNPQQQQQQLQEQQFQQRQQQQQQQQQQPSSAPPSAAFHSMADLPHPPSDAPPYTGFPINQRRGQGTDRAASQQAPATSPAFADFSLPPDAPLGLKAALADIMHRSNAALDEKNAVIQHLNYLVNALKEKLEEAEDTINALRDDLITANVEKDTATKNRDISYRERDMLLEERDFAVRSKYAIESKEKSQAQEVETLYRDRQRLREELDEMSTRHRKERAAWEDSETGRMETVDTMQRTLKEKAAALVILDRRCSDAEEKSRTLLQTNLDMLAQMESLNNSLARERVRFRDQELELDRLSLALEATEASGEQYRRLREEYVALQQEHTSAIDRMLQTRNVTEKDVRKESQREIEALKLTVTKWEAASKSQFKQFQNLTLQLERVAKERDSLVKENGDWQAKYSSAVAEHEAVQSKLTVLSNALNTKLREGATDEERTQRKAELQEVFAALEVVQRARKVKNLNQMVAEFTGAERKDAIVELSEANEELRRQLTVLAQAQVQLKRRCESAEDEADRTRSLAALKVKSAEAQRADEKTRNQIVLNLQADQIQQLRRAVWHGSEAASEARTQLSLDTDVGADNILQVSFGCFQCLLPSSPAEGVGMEFCLATLDFFAFDTVCTREVFTASPDFDSHFVFRLEETDDVRLYLSSVASQVQLLDADKRTTGVGLLSCAQLLGVAGRKTAFGRIAIMRPGQPPGRVVGFLEVRFALKRALPKDWVQPEQANAVLDGYGGAEVVPLAVQADAQVVLRNVVGLSVLLEDVAVEHEAKASIYTIIAGEDVWFVQAGTGKTRNPTFPGKKVFPLSLTDSSAVQALHGAPLPLVLFDDSLAEVTDCVGSANLSLKPLLSQPLQPLTADVTFLTASHNTAGRARITVAFVTEAELSAPTTPPRTPARAPDASQT